MRLGIALAVALVALVVTPFGYSGSSADEMDAEDALAATDWPDGRLVSDALCVALDGGGSLSATRFACQLRASYRPAGVQPARWQALVAAMRSHNTNRIRDALGLTASSTQADYAAVWRRWGLDRPGTVSVGVAAMAGRWYQTPVSLKRSSLTAILEAKRQLRASELSIAMYRNDHGTYAGMTPAMLRRAYDKGLDQRLVVASATKTSYCVLITTHKLTVSHRGTHSTAFLGPCSTNER